MVHLPVRFPSSPALLILLLLAAPLIGQGKVLGNAGRDREHNSPDWPTVEAHLADPATATLQKLQMQGDILRARRFPYSALDYYQYALKRDEKNTSLIKRIGITHLDLQNVELARAYFQRAVKLNKKDAEAWNNLGAVEYLDGNFPNAISDYKHAVKLMKDFAVYHSNLGIAYFDRHDYNSGRKEMDIALKLNPNLLSEGSSTGVSAHVLSAQDRARFCLEMAKIFAQAGNEAEMLHSLEKAAQGGLDVLDEMEKDKILAGYRKDPRVLLVVQNAKALRRGNTVAAADNPPSLPALSEASK